jgi:hypothetical protein
MLFACGNSYVGLSKESMWPILLIVMLLIAACELKHLFGRVYLRPSDVLLVAIFVMASVSTYTLHAGDDGVHAISNIWPIVAGGAISFVVAICFIILIPKSRAAHKIVYLFLGYNPGRFMLIMLLSHWISDALNGCGAIRQGSAGPAFVGGAGVLDGLVTYSASLVAIWCVLWTVCDVVGSKFGVPSASANFSEAESAEG